MLSRMPLRTLIAGLTAAYLGERILEGVWRWSVDAAGLALVVCALALAFLRVARSAQADRRVYFWLALGYGVELAALALYALHMKELGLVVSGGRIDTLLVVAWPVLAVSGLVPTIAMELAVGSMAKSPVLEQWRVAFAARGAFIVVLGIIIFAGVNYAASQWNRTVDLSYFKTAVPGESTRAIVRTLSRPVHFYLFFPPGNEVLEPVRGYIEALAAVNPHVVVDIVDQGLRPDLAKDLKVRSNGVLAIQNGTNNESLHLGLTLEDARSALRSLDGKVQEKLLRVLKPARVAYLTVGHLERDFSPPADDTRPGLSDLKSLLETLGSQVKRLGLGEGLGQKVPEDASVVLVVGPTEPLLAEEVRALLDYFNRGGRLMVFADPDNNAKVDELVTPLGLTVGKSLVANEHFLINLEGRRESPYNLVTTRVSSHASVRTVARSSGRLGVVMLGASAVSKRPAPPSELNISFTLHAMPDSWEDANGNALFDKDKEKRVPIELGAAVSKKIHAPASVPPQSPAPPTVSDKTKTKDEGDNEARALVVGDADVVGSPLLRYAGNAYFLLDSVRWLVGDEETAGEVDTDKDVPIVHRKEQDALWFYGTSLIVPALVLVAGLWGTSKKRGKRSAA